MSNIICDLDGTIALDYARARHLHKPECPKHSFSGHTETCICSPKDRNWDSYFAECKSDTPNRPIIKILQKFKVYHTIWILSGRSMSVSELTTQWLDEHNVPYNRLQMRGVDDRTADDVLKIGWAKFFDLHPGNTLFVLEDRTRVVNAWRKEKFTVLQVAAGDF